MTAITKFINDVLVKTFSRLKQGQNILNTFTKSITPNGKTILYKKNLGKDSIPLFELVFVAVTPIGAFILTINLNWYYSCDIIISLINVRSVDFGIRFSTGLAVRVMFGYGLPGIL